jgi:hypothetical protein
MNSSDNDCNKPYNNDDNMKSVSNNSNCNNYIHITTSMMIICFTILKANIKYSAVCTHVVVGVGVRVCVGACASFSFLSTSAQFHANSVQARRSWNLHFAHYVLLSSRRFR